VRRTLVAAGAMGLLAAGYFGGLLATGDALFRLELGIPAGPASALARTAEYWSGVPSIEAAPATSSVIASQAVQPPPGSAPAPPMGAEGAVAALVAAAPAELTASAPVKAASGAVASAGGTIGCAHGQSCLAGSHQPLR
jgi:hypothetical protein